MGTREWLEADGLGGFASGTADGIRTRRYHAWLLAANEPPGKRSVLVSGADVWLTTSAGRFALSSQRYRDGVVHPDGVQRLLSFSTKPWPTWTYATPDGCHVIHELCVVKGVPAVIATWRLREPWPAASLEVRPFLAGRDYHALRQPGSAPAMRRSLGQDQVAWRLSEALPDVFAYHNGTYQDRAYEYAAFDYEDERARGFDCREDLAAPGTFTFDLAAGDAHLIFAADRPGDDAIAGLLAGGDARATAEALRARERARRAAFPSALHAAADSYLVRRGSGKTIIAGYPWFLDWGRDTFIALRGLCLATGRLDEARDILLEWTQHVSRGMLPNRFPDGGGTPEFNAADAALWFTVAAHELLTHADSKAVLRPAQRRALHAAIVAIVQGYLAGTRHGIAVAADGLLAAGEPGVQLTWMDAKVGDAVMTPRIGKPVELQALWCNALAAAAAIDHGLRHTLARAADAFVARFWRDERGYLLDVADADHVHGRDDASFRPNQIFAVGGLPFALLDGARASAVVDAVEARLLTPLGLRSLAQGDPRYCARYAGAPHARDAAYHNGTVWPWLMGPFVEAWVRVRGNTAVAKEQARDRFLVPLLAHLDEAGLGHISEVADGDAPHHPGGCPFQAWSVGEALRLAHSVLGATAPAPTTRMPLSTTPA
jgi:predicted glycogen debranching enzyme